MQPRVVQEKEGFMATLDERFQKGLEMRERLAGGQGRIFRGAVPVAYELAPDMYRISTECLYGSIWNRPGLDLRYRAIASFTVTAIQLVTPQIRAHVRNALNVDMTPEEIIEVCMMIAFYGGIPAAYNALAMAKEVFEERGLQVTLPETFDPAVAPHTLYERGIAKHQELMPDVFGYHPTEPTPEEYALDVLMQEYLWGAVWTRPGLDMKSRVVCALAAMVVRGQYDLSVRRMIEGALRYGLSRSEIMELAMQLVFYVGILPARAFMHIANTVFRSPEFAQTDSAELQGKSRGAP
jgi:4-carboxymuconolactone decarboxylase